MDQAFIEKLVAHAGVGMVSAFWAQIKPERVAVWDRFGTRTYRQINENSNRLARVFRKEGLKPGDSIALFCTNRAEFIETLNASRRIGLRITPVNWHLAASEIAYILADCEARALIAETKFDTIREAVKSAPGIALKLSVGGQADGFTPYEDVLYGEDASDIIDPIIGSQMLYTSGTTGRPKGVHRPHGVATPPMYAGTNPNYDPDKDVQMCVGPGYHAAPLAFDIAIPQASGVSPSSARSGTRKTSFAPSRSGASRTRTWCQSCSSACWRRRMRSRGSTTSHRCAILCMAQHPARLKSSAR